MAFDEKLAERVRKAIAAYKVVNEIKMFGGLCFTLHGNMCCGVLRDDLVIRLPPDQCKKALAEPHVRPMDFTGRPLKGFLYVAPPAVKTEASLKKWIARSARFALSMPPKY